jgi:hypothetical protein
MYTICAGEGPQNSVESPHGEVQWLKTAQKQMACTKGNPGYFRAGNAQRRGCAAPTKLFLCDRPQLQSFRQKQWWKPQAHSCQAAQPEMHQKDRRAFNSHFNLCFVFRETQPSFSLKGFHHATQCTNKKRAKLQSQDPHDQPKRSLR